VSTLVKSHAPSRPTGKNLSRNVLSMTRLLLSLSYEQ
jgi:hypothetical protein